MKTLYLLYLLLLSIIKLCLIALRVIVIDMKIAILTIAGYKSLILILLILIILIIVFLKEWFLSIRYFFIKRKYSRKQIKRIVRQAATAIPALNKAFINNWNYYTFTTVDTEQNIVYDMEKIFIPEKMRYFFLKRNFNKAFFENKKLVIQELKSQFQNF